MSWEHVIHPLPTVAAVMLVNGREAMVRRAVECARAQTYGSLSLIVLDTGEKSTFNPDWAIDTYRFGGPFQTVGELRNRANALTDADIIVHVDSDDWSHPRRVEEQVALLQASGADAVGYNEAIFWREAACNSCGEPFQESGRDCETDEEMKPEAWLYSNPDRRYCLGASLCYWRRTWERKPFLPISQGEDFRFCVGLKTVGVSSFNPIMALRSLKLEQDDHEINCSPRFIARIHAGNTSTAYSAETMSKSGEWRRAPEWDLYSKGNMGL